VSVDFLTVDPRNGIVARSPIEREALAAGGRFEQRDGWNVAVEYAGPKAEHQALRERAGFADTSHLGKLELNGRQNLELGLAERRDGAWWCPVTRERTLVLCAPGALAGLRERHEQQAVEVTTTYAALTIAGPLAREMFARFCALDLRPQSAPPGAFRPASVARTPGYVLREGDNRFLMLFGWAFGRYVWETITDAAEHLGAAPVGIDALGAFEKELAHA
jgi:heterotetrameric sarcosine oxidase gamma subunit